MMNEDIDELVLEDDLLTEGEDMAEGGDDTL